ncbi:MAG: hypothetical protein R2848_00295 [Thermomicrobiales bacterium]
MQATRGPYPEGQGYEKPRLSEPEGGRGWIGDGLLRDLAWRWVMAWGPYPEGQGYEKPRLSEPEGGCGWIDAGLQATRGPSISLGTAIWN